MLHSKGVLPGCGVLGAGPGGFNVTLSLKDGGFLKANKKYQLERLL